MFNSKSMLAYLASIYGEEIAGTIIKKLEGSIGNYAPNIPIPSKSGLDQEDAILITYGDQVQQPGELPLHTLAAFCLKQLKGLVSGIHILPFYPYSSDDGFSVIDYREVDPALGSWEDIVRLGHNFRLMFDAVINHISTRSAWFQGYLRGDRRYQEYFIEVEDNPDLSHVVRPRSLPLLTHFPTSKGEKALWTTFSADQIDLNYHNPEVLLEILDLLLFYATKGAEFIRLDAIAYLWKEIGTSCIHLPQTHLVIQLMRTMLDQVAPQVRLITETNVPHSENISYFGDGINEANMVYNFALPPLVLYTLQHGNAATLSAWADSLRLPSNQVTFFNFLASHDGIGITPLRTILPDSAIDEMVSRTQQQGGLVSYRANPDGSQSPYELNINYFDALSTPNVHETIDTQVARFSAAHAIAFSIVGVPGIYFHSLFGSRGWLEGVQLSGQNRTINRQKFTQIEMENALSDPHSLRSRVFAHITRLLRARASHPAFNPTGKQTVVVCGKQVFALMRSAPESTRRVLCLQNVTAQPVLANCLPEAVYRRGNVFLDLISGEKLKIDNDKTLGLAPYQSLWLDLDGTCDNLGD
jgi:glucosylglycerate phosphorylase